ncbi:MATE family efflux transporter [Halobacteriales archaeon QS_5_70_15]|nr:MAG: MATE family efflux transporter [Halobacteriales archaeon QS_5_70_15]
MLDRFPALLARLGVVDRRMGEEAFDLAAPVMVTGALRVLIRISDFLFVGIATGAAGIAALELGFQYFFIAFGLALALTSGTISVVSRFLGADDRFRADLVIKQSLWLGLLVSIPLAVAGWLYAEPLVGLLTDDAATIRKGADYLRIVLAASPARFWSMIAARALAGAGDTRTPMYVRLVTLPANVVLNALLVFGIGPFPMLGVAGAALGTATAYLLSAGAFLALLLTSRFPVRLRLGGPQVDLPLMAEIARVGLPLAGTRLSRTFGRFPFLFVLGVLGTSELAAYAVGRRVVLFAMMPAWGYSTAASTLVGQSVGGGEDERATAYGWQTTRIALATQLLVAAVIAAFAPYIARGFGTEDVALTATFVRVFALGVAGFSVSRTMRGALRGAGDTRWPFYGTVLGTYLVRLPIAFLALPVGYAVGVGPVSLGGSAIGPLPVSPGMGFGVSAAFVAILAGLYVKAFVNTARFASGRWVAVARSGMGATPGDD